MSQTTPGATAPILFQFQNTQLRVVMRGGEPWFVAIDVCEALELGNTPQAVSRLDDDEHTIISNDSQQIQCSPRLSIVNESGLYSLILGSRKPEAKKFKKWVTSEVLPSIRKTGRYQAAVTPVADVSVVDLLTTLLEKAKAGEITGITGVANAIEEQYHLFSMGSTLRTPVDTINSLHELVLHHIK